MEEHSGDFSDAAEFQLRELREFQSAVMKHQHSILRQHLLRVCCPAICHERGRVVGVVGNLLGCDDGAGPVSCPDGPGFRLWMGSRFGRLFREISDIPGLPVAASPYAIFI